MSIETAQSYPAIIGGEKVDAAQTFEDLDPSTGQPCAQVARCGEGEIDQAVEAALRTHEDTWRRTIPAERARILHRIAELLRRGHEEIARLESMDTGKPLTQARADATVAARYFEFYANTVESFYGDTIPALEGTFVYTLREPYGVTAHIVPWNYPIQISSRSIAPALATGNCCVVKPAEEAPLTTIKLAELVLEAGLPAGALNVVPGYGEEAGAALAAHPSIDHLAFTGSLEVGQIVSKAAADNVEALLEAGVVSEQPDGTWTESMRAYNREKTEKFVAGLGKQPPGSDRRMHPQTLLAAVNEFIDGDTIVVADGGDILSFARAALRAETYLDPGALGCLGVGVPFAVSAALIFPDRRVIAVIGDGSFGLSAIEIDTAVRSGARAVFVVANNGAWGIERNDQLVGYNGNLVGVDLPGCRYDLVAQGLGAYAERIERPEDLTGAIERALENAPALLDVAVTKEAESPDFKNGLAGVPDRQALEIWDRAEKRRHVAEAGPS